MTQLFLGTTADSPDEPDGESDEENQPPKVAQFARRHFGEGGGTREEDDEQNADDDEDSELVESASARGHGVGDFSTGPRGRRRAAPVLSAPDGTTIGERPFQRSTIFQRRKDGL